MEENESKIPSLPPNYVTLVQLRERWMKAQQRKNISGKEKEEQVPEKKSEAAVCFVSSETTKSKIETKGLKKNEKGKEKSNFKEWRLKKREEARARTENEATVGETHRPETSVEKDGSLKSSCVDVVVVTDRTVETERKFQDMSIDSGREAGNEKSVIKRPQYNGRYHWGKNWSNGTGSREYFPGEYQRFGNGLREGRKKSNAGMVWVKKGETFGVNASSDGPRSPALRQNQESWKFDDHGRTRKGQKKNPIGNTIESWKHCM